MVTFDFLFVEIPILKALSSLTNVEIKPWGICNNSWGICNSCWGIRNSWVLMIK